MLSVRSKRRNPVIIALLASCVLSFTSIKSALASDLVSFADFEGSSFGAWKVEGTAFGTAPAPGTLPNQMAVSGFRGKGMANSFHGGDDARGKLISPPFRIERPYIAFLIGGGGFAGKTCVNLIVDGKVVRTATGRNTTPGGSEKLNTSGWEVRKLRGKTAHLEIVDDASGGWGHITLDEIEFTDTKPPMWESNVTRAFSNVGHWLNFPIKNGAPHHKVRVTVNGKTVREVEIPLADGQPDWWSPLDMGDWKGKVAVVIVDGLSDDSKALSQVTSSDTMMDYKTLYREPLRPQFHFTAQHGWLNDPNGMAFYNGEYHLFFQHSPFDWGSALKYWGHAVSSDLVHWVEIEEALYPDSLGDMYSGSAVVDWKNTSGFGKDGKPPLVLMYTAAGNPFTQCIAYSNDGKHVTKFEGNPVIGNVTDGNRDPRVFWYEPTKSWAMAVYVEKDKKHTMHFYSSPDLKKWTLTGITEGTPGSNFLFECPDIFELPVDGDSDNKKWVLTAADSQYAIGTFDGKKFIPETGALPGHQGRGFYAAQTFSDEPNNRRIQMGWWQTDTPGMPFNQSMSLPLELRLVTTPDGPRMTWTPVRELESLRARTHTVTPQMIASGAENPFKAVRGELFELRVGFTPGADSTVAFQVRGVDITYNAKRQELKVGDRVIPAPLHSGKQRMTIYVDRVGLEIFASDGLVFVPLPINLDPAKKELSVSVQGDVVNFTQLEAYELRSAWR